MSQLSLMNFLGGDKDCTKVNLFLYPEAAPSSEKNKTINTSKPTSLQPNHNSQADKHNARFSVIVDSEFCLDRLYGGYYPDWASGGQWNRMLSYVANLSKACRTNGIQLTVAFRAGLEKEYKESLFKCNRQFKERLNSVILHLQNRGTPPPKVWWLPPTGLREVLCLAFYVHGIPVFFSDGDYYTDVMEHLHMNKIDGILTDDPAFALFNPPRLFGAHDFKLTYKGSLETKEYFLDHVFDEMLIKRLPLFASLLGNHIVTSESLQLFYNTLRDTHIYKADASNASKPTEDSENAMVTRVLTYVKGLSDPIDIDSVAAFVFAATDLGVEEGTDQLKKSIQYYERFNTSQKSVPPSVVTSYLEVKQVKSDGKHRKRNAVVNDEFDVYEDGGLNGADNFTTPPNQPNGEGNSTEDADVKNGLDEIASDMESMAVDEEVLATAEPLGVTVTPGDAILKLAVERHNKGLMAPLIVQSLVQREVRLQCYIENCPEGSPFIVEIYRPIRQSVYAILHNLNKHLYDTRKIAEEHGNTVNADDVTINVVEHYLGSLGAEVSYDMTVKPVPWPVPSVESLWLGVKPENKQRRMKAFLSCMNVGANPYMSSPDFPEMYLLICCVLRYLLKCDPMALSLDEVDAVLSMTTSAILYDVQTMQDMQLPVITTRGVHIASLVMAGIQHAMLVNDTCGAPIRRRSTFPWLYFDGKLLQYKLLRNGSTSMQRIDLCDGNMEQVVLMEKLRYAVLFGMENKLGEQPIRVPFNLTNAFASGRMFAPAFFRPLFPDGRGKGSLMGDFTPVNARLDGRGGKLQVAGQVVATWGPRPGSNRDSIGLAELNFRPNGYRGASQPSSQQKFSRRRSGYSQNRPNQGELKNRKQNTGENSAEVEDEKTKTEEKSVIIVTKDERDDQTREMDIPQSHADDSVSQAEVSCIGQVNGEETGLKLL